MATIFVALPRSSSRTFVVSSPPPVMPGGSAEEDDGEDDDDDDGGEVADDDDSSCVRNCRIPPPLPGGDAWWCGRRGSSMPFLVSFSPSSENLLSGRGWLHFVFSFVLFSHHFFQFSHV